MDEFGGAFKDADTVIVLPIYAASEELIAGVTAEVVAGKIAGPRVEFAPEFAAAVAKAADIAGEGDVVLTLGAGSVSHLAPEILAALRGDQRSIGGADAAATALTVKKMGPRSQVAK